MNDNPNTIKPPSILRARFEGADHRRNVDKSNGVTFSRRRTASSRGQQYLRNSNIRNPRRQEATIKDRNHKRPITTVDSNSLESDDEEFYSSLRTPGLEEETVVAKTSAKKDSVIKECTQLKVMAQDARVTKTCLLEWQKKIKALEDDLKAQDYAMQEVLMENRVLESKVEALCSGNFQLAGDRAHDQEMQKVLNQNKALAEEVERLTFSPYDRTEGATETHKVILERNKLQRRERQLEKALSAAQKEINIFMASSHK